MLDYLLRMENKYFLRSFLEIIMQCILPLHAVADKISICYYYCLALKSARVHPHKFIDHSRACKTAASLMVIR